MAGTSRQPIDEESFQGEAEDVEEQPLVRHCSRCLPSENTELAQLVHPGDFQPQNNPNDRQNNQDEFPSEVLLYMIPVNASTLYSIFFISHILLFDKVGWHFF
jgi:hypothetical protein